MATKVKLIADGVITPDQITLTTASSGTNTTAPATTAFVQQEISALVDSSPDALNTLNELAAALGDDANFSTTVTNSIALKAPLASPAFNSGTSNVVASFTSTDGTGAIQLADNAGNVELAAVGNDFHIQNAGAAAKMVVLNSGNVGIGTSSPATALEVKGDGASIQVSSADYDVALLGRRGSSGVDLDKGYMRLRNTGTTKVAIDSAGDSYFNGGNVGIGINTPLSKLHAFASTATGTPKDTYAVGLFDDDEGRIQVRATNNGSDGAVVGLSTGSHNWGLMATAAGTFSNAFAIGYADTSTDGNVFGVNSMSEKLVITTGGNVGIGITPTEGKLHVKSDGAGEVELLTLENSTGTNGKTTLTFKTTSTDSTKSAQIFAERVNASGHTDLAFRTYNGSTTEHMRIDSSGNVGIGTSSPSDKLEVSGTGGTRLKVTNTNTNWAALDLQSGGNQANYIFFRDDSAERARIQVLDNDILSISIGSSGTGEKLRIAAGESNTFGSSYGSGQGIRQRNNGDLALTRSSSSSGNESIIINNTNTANVIGIMQYRSNNGVQGQYLTGSSGGIVFTGSSDYRYKTNITPLATSSLDKIAQLRLVSYNWNEESNMPTDEQQIGVIAHEMEEVFPEFVEGEYDAIWTQEEVDEKGDTAEASVGDIKPQTVSLLNKDLIIHILKGMQELKTELDAAKARITELES